MISKNLRFSKQLYCLFLRRSLLPEARRMGERKVVVREPFRFGPDLRLASLGIGKFRDGDFGSGYKATTVDELCQPVSTPASVIDDTCCFANDVKGHAQRLSKSQRNSASNAKTLDSRTSADGELVFSTTVKAPNDGASHE